MSDMFCKQSTVTARDIAIGILAGVDEPLTMEAAERISEEYQRRGVYIRPEYLLDVWTERE